MTDKTLLVPGTQATNLVDGAGVTVYNAARITVGLSRDDLGGRPPWAWRELLSMEHEPGCLDPVLTSLEPDTILHAPVVLRSPYDRLPIDASFPYDWRADIRWNALQLIDHLKANRPYDGGRWNLIGHSQGGLLIVAASKLMATAEDFARLVARVALVGVPLAGTMRATDALMFGRRDLGDEQVVPIRAATRTWPAVYQMLPAWDAVVELDGTKLPQKRQLTHAEGWPGEVGKDGGIVEDMLLRAREFQALMRKPLERMLPHVAVLSILGRKQDTGVSVQWDGTWFRRPFLYEPGDTLVPAQQTLDHAGSQFGDSAVLIAGAPREHGWLCNDETAVKQIKRFVRRPVLAAPERSHV